MVVETVWGSDVAAPITFNSPRIGRTMIHDVGIGDQWHGHDNHNPGKLR